MEGADLTLDVLGVGIVLLSAIGYASYIVVVNKSRLKGMDSRKLAFYVFIFTTLMFGGKLWIGGGLQPVPDTWAWGNLILLAVLPTVISNITLLLAVRHIGGTLTSILGAMEPVTAVCIGAFVFGERFTAQEGVGIVLILIAVSMIILTGTIRRTLSSFVRKIRPRHA